jgi:hypothetical protein
MSTISGFTVQLLDGFTGDPELLGQVNVTIAGRKPPIEKSNSARFVFLNIGAGNYTISVGSGDETPYYVPVEISVTLPFSDPLWQAYPDLSLADRSKPLDDPSQPAAYRAQRMLATLCPTPHYPFPFGATLVRGTVLSGGAPLSGATVLRVGDAGGALSDAFGESVLYFDDVGGMGQKTTIRATHPSAPAPLDVPVTLQRGTTVSILMILTP